jgi:uncharacterized protein DUF4118
VGRISSDVVVHAGEFRCPGTAGRVRGSTPKRSPAALPGIPAAGLWCARPLIRRNSSSNGWIQLSACSFAFFCCLGITLFALFTTVLATLAYNYFFLPPLFHFTIVDPQNWIALLAFLVTAVVGSQLSERARRGTQHADQRRHEVERLYSFSQELWISEMCSSY